MIGSRSLESAIVAVAVALAAGGCKKDESAAPPSTQAPDATAPAGSLCCASGDTCSCTPVTCTETTTASCHCAAPGEGGSLLLCAGAICCLKAGGDCYCRKQATGITATCDPGDEPSAFCKRESVACAPGLTAVAGCPTSATGR